MLYQESSFTAEVFLRFWSLHGHDWTWQRYADELSDHYDLEGTARITSAAVRSRVSHHREAWAQEYGIRIEPRYVNISEALSAWPDLPEQVRRQWPYRALLYRAQERAGKLPLPPARYVSFVEQMRSRALIIRYDPQQRRLYVAPRTETEIETDPNMVHLSESRSAYESRHGSDHSG